MLRGTLSIKNPQKVERDLARIIATTINKGIKNAVSKITNDIKIATSDMLLKSDFANDLLYGKLSGDLGLPQGTSSNRLSRVIAVLVSKIQVEFIPLKISGTAISGGALNIFIGVDDFKDLIALPEAYIITDKGQLLNWVEWTLTRGDRIMIVGYDISYGAGKGRSGLAVMVKDQFETWRVPTQYAGTVNDNWISRTIEQNIHVYTNILEQVISLELGKL